MAQGFADVVSPTLVISDSGTSATVDSQGYVDKTKTTTVTLKINKDSATAGVGYVTFVATNGSAQLFTGITPIWQVWKFGSETQVGGILQKADGATFNVAGLPVASIAYAGALAFCSDGVRICKYDGSAWQQLSVAN